MLSKVRIAGHPIHPMLVAFPIALYAATVVTLLAYVGTSDVFWFRVALWANIGGVVMAAVAAIPGFIDLISLPRHSRAQHTGLRHAAFNVLSLALFAISAALLYRSAGGTVSVASGHYPIAVSAPLALSILGVLSTLCAGWLGWTMVQTHHVGVKPFAGEEVETAPEDVNRPQMPPTYVETYRTTIRH